MIYYAAQCLLTPLERNSARPSVDEGRIHGCVGVRTWVWAWVVHVFSPVGSESFYFFLASSHSVICPIYHRKLAAI